MSVKEESGKAGLKLNIQKKKKKIVAPKPITSQQIEGGKVEAVADFIFLGSRITEHADCSHEIKTLAPWKKAMTILDSVLKSRDITLPTRICKVKNMVFPVVMHGCENWTIKKTWH